MGDYYDRYPDAFGRGEETDPQPARRHFLGIGLPRQVRDDQPAIAEARPEGEAAPDDRQHPSRTRPSGARVLDREPAPRRMRRVGAMLTRPRPLVQRTPREICDDVFEQLNDSPFIDASGISISVDGSDVTLEGTINSLIAISLAQALVSNIPGVSRVQVQLRVQPIPHTYDTAGSPVYKIVE